MLNFLKKFSYGRIIRKLGVIVEEINAKETELAKLDTNALNAESIKLRDAVRSGEYSLDNALPLAFALVREAAKRTLGQRPYDVQLIGGIVLHRGAVAEMATGEGKTLAAVAPVYLNALQGEGVHVVTVNEYLARRDTVWMGQIYHSLGLSVACLVPNGAYLYDPAWKAQGEEEENLDRKRDTTGSFLVQQDFLRPISRRQAYLADVTYGTNHEFGFDYLRDNLAYTEENQVQRGLHFAIIDEVDSILIDEARTPLIISAPDTRSSEFYKLFARVVERLKPEEDYTVDEKFKSVAITDHGIQEVERLIGVKNIYAPENLRLVHYLEESLRARALFRRDRDYIVKNNEIIIVDEFTGRLLHGRRYSAGLHQAIEAKEGVPVKEESRTYAKISIQNYFRMYKKLAGMTGTAQTSAEEFYKVYALDVVSIPPNKPCVRNDLPDVIYKNFDAKMKAIVAEVKRRHEAGQPVLLGTTSIEKNELLSAYLARAQIKHEVLNAKNNEREGSIIAQAGRLKAVTVATNMAGRGVDIILGGNPPIPEEAQKVRELGGLHVIGTERHEARRIDNQLRGRAGRQGDPGSSQFFLSLEDDLLRIFGGDRIKSLMERFELPDDQPIEASFISKVVAQAQAKVEGSNFDLRKHLLEYDDVLNKQRTAVYAKRQKILKTADGNELGQIIFGAANGFFQSIISQIEKIGSVFEEKNLKELKKIFEESGVVTKLSPWPFGDTVPNISQEELANKLTDLITKRSFEISVAPTARIRVLGILDMLWMDHLENLEALQESIGLRAYGHKEPLVEFRREAHRLYQNFWANFDAWIFTNLFKLAEADAAEGNGTVSRQMPISAPRGNSGKEKVGRNDPCPCGSGKKYKKCHGIS